MISLLNGRPPSRQFDPPAAPPDDWLLWQLADSAFPTGAFAHSSGLEAAWQHGELRDAGELTSFLEAALEQLGRASLPFVTAAHDQTEPDPDLDGLCDCFLSNHVANRASRLQGRSFLASSARIFPDSGIDRCADAFPIGHFAPAFGAATRALGLLRYSAAKLFFFNHLRGLLAAAVRLGVVGPMQAQSLQRQLAPRAQSVLDRCQFLSLDDLAQTAPLLEIWQGAQDRLYSRLFQS